VFRRILVANRGEIAARVLRACNELGVESVAIFSAADQNAPWLRLATKAVCIGPARAAESYLNADAVLQVARQENCQAVHPGYGFLSENSIFAARCAEQGLTFVGPSAVAIQRMGDKAAAKRTMADHGLPTIPGSDGVVSDLEDVKRIAEEFGFPLLLKASAGGGGKGMRRCDRKEDLQRAYDEARQEAEAAFGNGALYVEKLIEGGRHIEFQVLCDRFGKGVHLGERDCSIQRKNQKLIEESPSPVMDAATRDKMGRRVAAAVSAAGYSNAGTVEFLRDPSGSLYFMEINARLQVEHPVTEMVTGVDLVQQQLRVAANEPLSFSQDSVTIEGHAIEFRINAERVEHDFAPDPGEISRFVEPLLSADVRWDSAVEEGYRIPPWYDSMIGKLIVRGSDRGDAIARAKDILSSMILEGVETTIPLHRRLLEDEQFVSGDYNLNRLEQVLA